MKHKKRGAGTELLLNLAEYCRAEEKLKKKYISELDAELNAPSPSLNQYKCEFCRMWHNGNGSVRMRKRFMQE